MMGVFFVQKNIPENQMAMTAPGLAI